MAHNHDYEHSGSSVPTNGRGVICGLGGADSSHTGFCRVQQMGFRKRPGIVEMLPEEGEQFKASALRTLTKLPKGFAGPASPSPKLRLAEERADLVQKPRIVGALKLRHKQGRKKAAARPRRKTKA